MWESVGNWLGNFGSNFANFDSWTDFAQSGLGQTAIGAGVGGLAAEATGGDWRQGAALGAAGGLLNYGTGVSTDAGAGYNFNNTALGTGYNYVFGGGTPSAQKPAVDASGRAITVQPNMSYNNADNLGAVTRFNPNPSIGTDSFVDYASFVNKPVSTAGLSQNMFNAGAGTVQQVGPTVSNAAKFGGDTGSSFLGGLFSTSKEGGKSSLGGAAMQAGVGLYGAMNQKKKDKAQADMTRQKLWMDMQNYNREMAMQEKLANQQYDFNQVKMADYEEDRANQLRRNAQQEAAWTGAEQTYVDANGNVVTVNPSVTNTTNAFQGSALSRMYA